MKFSEYWRCRVTYLARREVSIRTPILSAIYILFRLRPRVLPPPIPHSAVIAFRLEQAQHEPTCYHHYASLLRIRSKHECNSISLGSWFVNLKYQSSVVWPNIIDLSNSWTSSLCSTVALKVGSTDIWILVTRFSRLISVVLVVISQSILRWFSVRDSWESTVFLALVASSRRVR